MESIYVLALTGILAGSVGFFVGRRMSRDTVRARELETELEDLRKEHEISLAEVEAAKHEWKRTQAELERYRNEVVDHFSGTAEMLHDLTLQYRAVYDHLTDGSKLLCPEGSLSVDTGAGAALLPQRRDPAESDETTPADRPI